MSSRFQNDTATRSFKILSLDGGGIRGAFGASFLARVEAELATPISKYFDLVVGTSTGAILATAIASGVPAAKVRDLYEQSGPKIFSRSVSRLNNAINWLARFKIRDFDLDHLLRAKYEPTELRKALDWVLEETVFKDVLLTRLLVTAVDLTKSQTTVFRTPHLPGMIRDPMMPLVDAVMSSTAAPTYFPMHRYNNGSFCDGGVWANNPALIAFAEAMRISRECADDSLGNFGPGDIKIVSIGTGTRQYDFQPEGEAPGIWAWKDSLIEVIGLSQSQAASFTLKHLLGNDDQVMRVDFELRSAEWKLDNVALLSDLIHLGDEAAVERLGELREFIGGEVVPYKPVQ